MTSDAHTPAASTTAGVAISPASQSTASTTSPRLRRTPRAGVPGRTSAPSAIAARSTAAAAIIAVGLAGSAAAAEGAFPKQPWSFNGVFGSFDKAALQRGFQVYQEVCAGCHGVKYIAFRNLTEIGLNEDQVKAIAAEYEFEDGPDDEGEMFTRPAILSDILPSPFANDNAARASNNGALPPDLSLIVKARSGAEAYIYSLLSGYEDAPDDFKLADDFLGHENVLVFDFQDHPVKHPLDDSVRQSVANFLEEQ